MLHIQGKVLMLILFYNWLVLENGSLYALNSLIIFLILENWGFLAFDRFFNIFEGLC